MFDFINSCIMRLNTCTFSEKCFIHCAINSLNITSNKVISPKNVILLLTNCKLHFHRVIRLLILMLFYISQIEPKLQESAVFL